MLEQPLELRKWPKRAPYLDMEIEGLLPRVLSFREMPQCFQGLLEVPRRLAVRRARVCLCSGLAEVGHGLLPGFAPQCVVGESLDLLCQAVGIDRLDRLQDL